MKLGAQSHISIVSAVKKALTKYSSRNGISEITDIYMQPDPLSGNLLVCNDDEEQLIIVSVPEWVEANPENFMADAEMALRKVLNQLREEGFLNTPKILKPYSFVLVDDEKETVADLMLVDEEETMFLNDELLKGLDEELDAFLKDLLEK